MLIPFTHENAEARRWPILTTGLVIVNVICFLILTVAMNRAFDEIEYAQRALVDFATAHQTLPQPKVLSEEGIQIVPNRDNVIYPPPPPDGSPEDIEDKQAYERLALTLIDKLKSTPAHTWGYVPNENNILGLFTYQFLHGGVFHLLFNMWFMWLCATNLEDRWGRVLFLPMYLSAGIVAAVAHKLAVPTSGIPLIGASGSIAGAMGAFLILFARTRIRFFYWYFTRVGTFAAPAWLMLPLWLAEEVLWAILLPSGSDSTAHFAHIGGFVFGMAFAGFMVVSGFDKKLDAIGEKKVTTEQDARILFAGRMIDEGRNAEAISTLEQYVTRKPDSIDAYLELLRAAAAVHDERRLVTAYGRLIDLYVQTEGNGSLDAADDLHNEAEQRGVAKRIALATRAKLAEKLAAANLGDRAARVYGRIVADGVTDVGLAHAAIAYARILCALRREVEAGKVLDQVEQSKLPGFDAALNELRARVSERSIAL